MQSHYHLLDLLMIAVLCFLTLLGLVRGIVAESLGALALLIIVFISIIAVQAGLPALISSGYLPPQSNQFVKVVLFLFALGFAAIVPSFISKTFGSSTEYHIGFAGRIGGAIVGLLKGCGWIAATFILLEMVWPPENWPETWKESQGLPIVYQFVKAATQILPPDIQPPLQAPPHD